MNIRERLRQNVRMQRFRLVVFVILPKLLRWVRDGRDLYFWAGESRPTVYINQVNDAKTGWTTESFPVVKPRDRV